MSEAHASEPAPHDSAPITSPTPAATRRLGVAIVVLSAVGLALAGYLTAAAWVRGVEPIGCGAGSGCAAVLTSEWSRVAAVPVSAPAAALYTLVLALGVMGLRTGVGGAPLGRAALAFAAAALVAGAAWFVTLQATVIQAWCAYCLVSHGVGVLLAGIIAALLVATARGASRVTAPAAALAGVAGVALLAGVQWTSDPIVHHIEAFELELVLEEQPIVGPIDAEHHVLVMLDYQCPVCRQTHATLKDAMARFDATLALVALPVPLHPGCNPHAPAYPADRFAESCDIARIALAVHRADPLAYAAFEDWLFEHQPVTADAARAEAAERVGEATLSEAMNDPWIDQAIDRNTAAYGHSGADRLPVIVVGDASPIIGRVDSPDRIIELLE